MGEGQLDDVAEAGVGRELSPGQERAMNVALELVKVHDENFGAGDLPGSEPVTRTADTIAAASAQIESLREQLAGVEVSDDELRDLIATEEELSRDAQDRWGADGKPTDSPDYAQFRLHDLTAAALLESVGRRAMRTRLDQDS